MKHKTAELEHALLDAAVATADGHKIYFGLSRLQDGIARLGIECWRDESHWPVKMASTEWREGGPIIDRERITNGPYFDRFTAWLGDVRNCDNERGQIEGSTPLIAAMRAYVASKFGDEIEF